MYAGLFSGALIFGYVRRWDAFLMRWSGVILFAAVAIPGIDWLLGYTGLWANTVITQTATGGVFGIVAGYYFARACAKAGTSESEAPSSQMVARSRA